MNQHINILFASTMGNQQLIDGASWVKGEIAKINHGSSPDLTITGDRQKAITKKAFSELPAGKIAVCNLDTSSQMGWTKTYVTSQLLHDKLTKVSSDLCAIQEKTGASILLALGCRTGALKGDEGLQDLKEGTLVVTGSEQYPMIAQLIDLMTVDIAKWQASRKPESDFKDCLVDLVCTYACTLKVGIKEKGTFSWATLTGTPKLDQKEIQKAFQGRRLQPYVSMEKKYTPFQKPIPHAAFRQIQEKIDAHPLSTAYPSYALFDAMDKQNVGRMKALSERKETDVNQLVELGYMGSATLISQCTNYHNPALTEALIAAGADLNNGLSLSPLHGCVFDNNTTQARILLDHGANPNASLIANNPSLLDLEGLTPLELAIRFKKEDMCHLLLAYGANPHVQLKGENCNLFETASNYGLNSAAMKAVQNASLVDAAKNQIFKRTLLLIVTGADINAKDQKGFCALHYAVFQNNREIAYCLLKYKANPNVANQDGTTALHMAVRKNNLYMTTVLLQHGADANGKNTKGKTPLDVAREKEFDEIVVEISKYDVQEKKETTATMDSTAVSKEATKEVTREAAMLAAAAQKGGYQQVIKLLEAGADINAQNETKFTALHYAVFHKDYYLAKVLLSKGAGVNMENSQGTTALHLAVRNGHESLVSLLLEYGANPNVSNANDNTPVHVAAKNNQTEIAVLLVQNGGNESKNKEGQTPSDIWQAQAAKAKGETSTDQTKLQGLGQIPVKAEELNQTIKNAKSNQKTRRPSL